MGVNDLASERGISFIAPHPRIKYGAGSSLPPLAGEGTCMNPARRDLDYRDVLIASLRRAG